MRILDSYLYLHRLSWSHLMSIPLILRVFAAAVTSAVMLQLAVSTLNYWPLVFVALIPILASLRGLHWSYWCFCGFCIGLFCSAFIVDGTVKWGILSGLTFVFAISGVFAIIFTLSGILSRYLPFKLRGFALVLCWVPFTHLLDNSLYFAIFLSAPVSLAHSWLLTLVEIAGISTLEALILIINCIFVELVRARHRIEVLRCLIYLGICGMTSMAIYIVGSCLNEKITQVGHLIGIQPNISWADYSASGWSLERRSAIEAKLDRLSQLATNKPAGTIVWPENGNGLANSQLQRRLQIMSSILKHGTHDLLAPAREFDGGMEYLAMFHHTRDGVKGRVRKSNLVPMAESDLTPGKPGVLETQAGKLGVAICFDAMFSSHFQNLVKQGAEALIVTTDNASFGMSNISGWHQAYSVLRAAEVGRSLMYVSNTGPSLLYNHHSRTIKRISEADIETIYKADIPLSNVKSFARQGFRHLIPLLSILIIFVCLIRRKPSKLSIGPAVVVHKAILMVSLMLPSGVFFDAMQRAEYTQEGLRRVLSDIIYRSRGHVSMDALGPLFQQSSEKSCGATALAFALTILGDHIFEEQVAKSIPAIQHKGSSLAQLARIAEQRGFKTVGWNANNLSDITFGPGMALISHLKWNHFVVVFKLIRGQVILLDPAVGSVLRVPISEFEEKWSGYGLAIITEPSLKVRKNNIL